MKAVRWTSDDRPGLVMDDEAMPNIGTHDVLVQVKAAALNYRDQAILDGKYGGPRQRNGVPLSDGAGVVVAVGSGVSRARIGERVALACHPHWISGPPKPEYHSQSHGMTSDGMLAEFAATHENGIVHLPEYLSFEEAATLPCAAVTAWTALTQGTPLQPGQTVLVQGTGGVSLFALQIAQMFGARVFAITSSPEKADILRGLGADEIINYVDQPDWDHEVLEKTAGLGVDKIVDIAGEMTIRKSAAATRIGGAISVVGFTSGFGGGLPPIDILFRALQVSGVDIGPRTSFEALLQAMTYHRMKPVIDSTFAFNDYEAAYRRLASGQHVGKVVITTHE